MQVRQTHDIGQHHHSFDKNCLPGQLRRQGFRSGRSFPGASVSSLSQMPDAWSETIKCDDGVFDDLDLCIQNVTS